MPQNIVHPRTGLMWYYEFGTVVTATALGAGATSAAGQAFYGMEWVRSGSLWVQSTQTYEVGIFRTLTDGTLDWGLNLVTGGSNTGGTAYEVKFANGGGTFLNFTSQVQFFVKNTGAGAGNFTVKFVGWGQ